MRRAVAIGIALALTGCGRDKFGAKGTPDDLTPPDPHPRADATTPVDAGTGEPRAPTVYCLNDVYGAALHCSCVGKACPGQSQVCVDFGLGILACRTCGEKSSDGATCQDGKTCKADRSKCD